MDPILSALPQLAGLIEKGGVVGVLLIVCGVLVYEVRRGRRHLHQQVSEMQSVCMQRDRALLAVMKLKTLCEAKGLPVDLRDVQDLLPAQSMIGGGST